MKTIVIGVFFSILLAACSSPNINTRTGVRINNEMDALVEQESATKPEAVDKALLPPLAAMIPKIGSALPEERFELAVNNLPAKKVFAAIGADTHYNMLPLPGVEGNITLSLKNVTLFEALDTIRALYGYDYKVDGNSIYIQPLALQIRLFKIDYLAAMRDSTSSLTVKSSGQSNISGVSSAAPTVTGSTLPGTGYSQGGVSSSVSTRQSSGDFNFWQNLEDTITAIITPKGKSHSGESSVVINRMSGIIMVRAMPEELRNVEAFLKASQLAVERQVIIEAKFIEVTLSEGYQSGVNWAAIGNSGGSNYSTGVVAQGGTLTPSGAGGVGQPMSNSAIAAVPGSSLSGISTGIPGALFGLAFQTGNFGAMLNFLETQGSVHVLSSPRISTLNNQKAVLKVGTDEPYATGYTPGTSASVAGGTNTLPTPVYTQLFSGIALDVTPRINEKDEIILHVHPSISSVTSKVKDAGNGTTLQMASTSIEETDSVVRVKDGQIVVIGGLMSQGTAASQSGIPGLIKSIFGQTGHATEKRELVILLKPTVVGNDKVWAEEIARMRDRMNGMSR